MCRGGLLLLAAAAQCAAAPGAGDLASGGAPRSEAEAEGQQECEHAAMRVQALQTRSSLAGARSHEDPEPEAADPGPKPLGPADLDMRELTGYAEGNPYVPGPNVYLKEMVDPSNCWGYCLDIAGSPPKPLCESVQGHSCKTEGEDTQFTYDIEKHEIRSVNFNHECDALYSGNNSVRVWKAAVDNTKQACLQVDGDFVAGATLSMGKCDGQGQQKFIYTPKMQFAVGDGTLCLVLGTEREALPDMVMRSAELQRCDSWPSELSTWEVLLEDHVPLSSLHPPPAAAGLAARDGGVAAAALAAARAAREHSAAASAAYEVAAKLAAAVVFGQQEGRAPPGRDGLRVLHELALLGIGGHGGCPARAEDGLLHLAKALSVESPPGTPPACRSGRPGSPWHPAARSSSTAWVV
ncbi:unnamed protein product [Prorocentrum cordatum]|uniref:Cellulase n=1 Tax=Prorocentrum cordatum TaxID=2364126 RepID=A0ABN9SZQ7_9DINO|nr:unnamed protein product [Polarella glacialis]